MAWEHIKELMEDLDAPAIIVEDGAPRYVVVSVEAWKALQRGDSGQPSSVPPPEPPSLEDPVPEVFEEDTVAEPRYEDEDPLDIGESPLYSV